MPSSFGSAIFARFLYRRVVGQYLSRNLSPELGMPAHESWSITGFEYMNGTVFIFAEAEGSAPQVFRFPANATYIENILEIGDLWFTPTDFQRESWGVYETPLTMLYIEQLPAT